MTTGKNDLIKEVEQQIDNRNGEIAKFRVIAEAADPDDQMKFYGIIEEIGKKENAVKEKLEEFEKSDEDNLDNLKKEIVKLQRLVEQAIEEARVKVN